MTTTIITITLTLTGADERIAAGAERLLSARIDDLARAAACLSHEADADGDRSIPRAGARAPLEITSSSSLVEAALHPPHAGETWRQIGQHEVPADVGFLVRPEHAGQIVEIAYADDLPRVPSRGRAGGMVPPYKRVTNTSVTGPERVRYYTAL